jgi:zinc transport system substrate-binding protein
MAKRIQPLLIIVEAILILSLCGCQKKAQNEAKTSRLKIVTSDTLLSGMIASLMPPDSLDVAAIMPPGQCPGHYDVKLSDIEKIKKADLVVSTRGMPFMNKIEIGGDKLLLLDAKGRNWMAPDSYIIGLKLLAAELSTRFPQSKQQITARLKIAISEIMDCANTESQKIKRAGVNARPVIAASMQKEPLEWMGFHVVGEYGRPEAMSAKEIVDLTRIGKEKKAVIVVDNLQSGPDAGKGIAEGLGTPHVILSNFPSEKGYAATLSENVDAVLAAVGTK